MIILYRTIIYLQGEVRAMFNALNNSPKPVLEPVGASRLAQRRGKNRSNSSTAV